MNMSILIHPCTRSRGTAFFLSSPRATCGTSELFFNLPPDRQRSRIRELRRCLSEDLVAVLTRRGIGAVREAMVEART